jgi:RNA polymerase sigma-70 factor (sigma-E family)
MTDDAAVRELERFLAERADRLMRTAVLLAGGRDAGQDLLQTALERIIRHWRRLDGDPEAYLRRTLYNLAADGFRRQGRLQRKLALLRPVTQPPADPTAEVDLRDALVRLLLRLPPRQRAVLVLRYWEQLTEAETAAVLGWPEGTVKSATARGLQRLRELADGWPETGRSGRSGSGGSGGSAGLAGSAGSAASAGAGWRQPELKGLRT